MKNKKGFTLIELLVVIAIIGLLSTLAVVALNNARIKSRDARRVSDIKQIQTSLELYMNDEGQYPATPTVPAPASGGCIAGHVPLTGLCVSSTNGILATCAGTTYMASMPADPLDGTVPDSYCYISGGTTTYNIRYKTEGTVAGMDCTGGCIATPAGMND